LRNRIDIKSLKSFLTTYVLKIEIIVSFGTLLIFMSSTEEYWKNSMDLITLLLTNWDTVGLIFTNIIALLVKSPLEKKNG
jgi:hypothetical protein